MYSYSTTRFTYDKETKTSSLMNSLQPKNDHQIGSDRMKLTVKQLIELVPTRPIIQFGKAIEDNETYLECNMRGRVLAVEMQHDDLVKLTVDVGEFDEYNKPFESANYYDKNGTACLTAREYGEYKPVMTLYLDKDLEYPEGTFVDITNSKCGS